jgi:hypothetical protein
VCKALHAIGKQGIGKIDNDFLHKLDLIWKIVSDGGLRAFEITNSKSDIEEASGDGSLLEGHFDEPHIQSDSQQTSRWLPKAR